jgi:hypothetical protein
MLRPDWVDHQARLLLAYTNSLPPLENWERMLVFHRRNPVSQREAQHGFIPCSFTPPELQIQGVRRIAKTLLYQPRHRGQRGTRVLDYYGHFMKLREFKNMPFACYTSVDISEETMKEYYKDETHRYVVVGDPRCSGAQIACVRGPNNSKASSSSSMTSSITHHHFYLFLSNNLF